MKDIVFDYFNIITKEYEIAYEKWKSDPVYAEAVQKIKDEVDNEYVAKKFEEIPSALTKEKTQMIIDRKQEMINEILMKSINSRPVNAQGQIELDQKQLVYEIGKFDDILYIEEGFRKEEIERAIEVYQLDKKDKEKEAAEYEEERKAYEQMMAGAMRQRAQPAVAAAATHSGDEGRSTVKPTGKKLILE